MGLACRLWYRITSETAILQGTFQILMTFHFSQQISLQISQILELLNNLLEVSVLQRFLVGRTAMYKWRAGHGVLVSERQPMSLSALSLLVFIRALK